MHRDWQSLDDSEYVCNVLSHTLLQPCVVSLTSWEQSQFIHFKIQGLKSKWSYNPLVLRLKIFLGFYQVKSNCRLRVRLESKSQTDICLLSKHETTRCWCWIELYQDADSVLPAGSQPAVSCQAALGSVLACTIHLMCVCVCVFHREFAKERTRVEKRQDYQKLCRKQKRDKELSGYLEWIFKAGWKHTQTWILWVTIEGVPLTDHDLTVIDVEIWPNSDSFEFNCGICVTEEVMLAEEDKNAEEKSLDGSWYKRKHNNSGEGQPALKTLHNFTEQHVRGVSWCSPA